MEFKEVYEELLDRVEKDHVSREGSVFSNTRRGIYFTVMYDPSLSEDSHTI